MSDMSRKEAIDWLCRLRSHVPTFMPKIWQEKIIKALDFAIASLEADEAYQLMYEAPEEVTDIISREAVIDLCKDLIDRTDAVDFAYEVRRLPSVIPKRMRARWDFVQYDANPKIGNYHCSNCRATFQADGMDWEYCPRCGCYMREND